METIEEVILDDIWTVFNKANKDREPMLSGDDEDKITALLEKYHQAKLKLLGIPLVSSSLDDCWNSEEDNHWDEYEDPNVIND